MSTKRTHCCVSILWRLTQEGQLLFLVIPTRDGSYYKFPGGTNKEHPHETPVYTRDRELLEETNLWAPVWRFVREYRAKSKETDEQHSKFFYLMGPEGYSGEERLVSIKDGEDELPPPKWVTLQDLVLKVFPSHRSGFEDALLILARMHPRLKAALEAKFSVPA